MSTTLSDEALQKIYGWVDQVPLSRQKRNMARDFSDAVLTAEIIAHYHPHLIQLHNYSPSNSSQQKTYNWNTLQQKVLKKIAFVLSKQDIEDIVQCKSGAIERFLQKLQVKISKYSAKIQNNNQKVSSSPGQKKTYSFRMGSSSPTNNSRAEEDDEDDMSTSWPIGPLPSPGRSKYTTDDINAQVDEEVLYEKEETIQELKDTVQILEMKVQKLEQLVRIKDGKIQTLVAKLQDHAIHAIE